MLRLIIYMYGIWLCLSEDSSRNWRSYKYSMESTVTLATRPNSPIQVLIFQNQINSCFLLVTDSRLHWTSTSWLFKTKEPNPNWRVYFFSFSDVYLQTLPINDFITDCTRMNFIPYHATEQEYKFPCEDGRSWKITVENTCKLPGSTMSSTLHDPLFSRKCQTKLTIITNIINSVLCVVYANLPPYPKWRRISFLGDPYLRLHT